MIRSWAGYLWTLLTGAAALAYYPLAHYVSASDSASLPATLISLFPFAALLLALCWRSGQRALLITACILLGVAFALAWPHLQTHPSWMYFLEHIAANLLLALIFGRSLLGGRQALVSYFASFVHRPVMSAPVVRYTRQVTVAWTVFFLLTAGVSALLFALAPVASWSIFANLLSLPMIVAMFLGEYLVRMYVLPAHERSSIMGSIRAYRLSVAEWNAPTEKR